MAEHGQYLNVQGPMVSTFMVGIILSQIARERLAHTPLLLDAGDVADGAAGGAGGTKCGDSSPFVTLRVRMTSKRATAKYRDSGFARMTTVETKCAG